MDLYLIQKRFGNTGSGITGFSDRVIALKGYSNAYAGKCHSLLQAI